MTHKSILKSFKISNSNIDCVDIVDKKPLISIGSSDGSIVVQDFTSEKSILSLKNCHKDFIKKIFFEKSSSETVYSCSLDKYINILDVREKKGIVKSYLSDYEVYDLVQINENIICSASGKCLYLFDIRKDESYFNIMSGVKTLSKIIYNDNKVYSSSYDGSIRTFKFEENNLNPQKQYIKKNLMQ